MVHIIDHPLIKHKLTLMRMKETDSKNFKDYLDEIAGLMAYEITRDLPLKNINIETPVAKCVGYELDKKICLVPILRAGLGMVDGIKKAIPSAKVGHIGLYRDEDSLQPVQYFAKFPVDMKDSIVFVVDPMLATGGSACEAIKVIKSKGVKNIKLICLVGVDEGINYVTSHYPDVEIYLACKDEKLNENGYIIPGLGDAGDRIFGTK